MSNINFKDTIISGEEWPQRKAEFENIAIGQLPILKVDDQVFYQTEAINDWCAMQAGIVPSDAVKQMKIRMVTETLKETSEKAFLMGMAECMKSTGFIGIDEGKRDARNKVFAATVSQVSQAMLPKVEKTINHVSTLSGKYAMGDTITMVDLACLTFKLFFSCHDFQSAGDLKSILPKHGPTILKIANEAEKHPAVADYLRSDGSKKYTGLNIRGLGLKL